MVIANGAKEGLSGAKEINVHRPTKIEKGASTWTGATMDGCAFNTFVETAVWYIFSVLSELC
jgi:hypothetical protein